MAEGKAHLSLFHQMLTYIVEDINIHIRRKDSWSHTHTLPCVFSLLMNVLYVLWSLPVLQVFCRMFDCLQGAPQVEVGLQHGVEK